MISTLLRFLYIIKNKFELYSAKERDEYELNLGNVKFKLKFPQKKIISYSHLLRSKGKWEPHCTTAIKSLLNENDNVLQLGTAEGYFSCLMKKMQNEKVFFYGIEKSIEGYESIKKNFLTNKFKNYELINKIISNKSLGDEITFNDLLERIGKKVNFLFADIEGAEQFVFEDIIKYNIGIDKIVIGFHLIDEISSPERSKERYKYFYDREKFDKFMIELSKKYYSKIDIDNLILIKK
jgi:hypothetical protein